MDSSLDPNANYLLVGLPTAEFKHLEPHLELVSMPSGGILFEPGSWISYVHFPTTAIVSLLNVMENGSSSAIGAVGNEGLVGTSIFMGGYLQLSRAIVSTGGQGYRLKARVLMDEFNRAGGRRAGVMQRLLLRYAQALHAQTSQMAVCNRHHSLEQQLCRWLLQTLDRMPSNELTMTQEQIAGLLGVRREGITVVAGHLQKAGFIRYQRGHISVLDRSGLESLACECYAVIKKENDRLLHTGRNWSDMQAMSHA